jgi:ribosomal protein RSM22 (predicted rRNA methylase)
MWLSKPLASAVAEINRDIAPAELARASAELTSEYRGQRKGRPLLDHAHRAAYLLTRLPATYAVLSRIFEESKLRVPELRIESMLDLGAGPGTAMWSAGEAFPELRRAVLFEDSAEWIGIGQRLAPHSKSSAVRSAEWRLGSVTDQLPSCSFDLVVMSYVVNELPPSDMAHAVQAAWQRTGKMLVIAEPGTPLGFGHIREIRRNLIAAGAHVVAPCPHAFQCPMPANDWCHFAERLQRSSEHRAAKGARFGYEDEKYSYVAFQRESIILPRARVLRHPRKRSGHVELELCTTECLQHETVSRKQGDRYKKAKHAEWGSVWE